MDEKRPDLFRHTMRYGLFMGALFSANFLLSTLGGIGGMISYFVMGAIIYFTYNFTVLFRESECNGELTYGKGLRYVLLLYFFAAIISSVVKYVYFNWVNPEYLSNLLNQSMQVFESMSMPEEQMTTSINLLNKMMSPAFYAMQTLWMNVFMGLLVGLVMAAFTKKEKNLFEE